MHDLTERALGILSERDLAAMVEVLAAEPDPEVAAHTFVEAANDLYWQRKDLPVALDVARAGMVFCLYAARRHPERAEELRTRAKALAFNYASFAWPGWAEEGIAAERVHLDRALDAARANLRLAIELRKGPIAESRGHWLIGAVFLALGGHQQAIGAFREAAALASDGGSDGEADLNSAYELLARRAEDPGDDHLIDAFDDALGRLREREGGGPLVEQVEAAAAVFLP
jgi:tetratricopeptide (TPR) repeat protein